MNMTKHEIEQAICDGKTFLGIELGSTRIKAVLTGPDYAPVASGEHIWENRYQNGIWTYDLDDVWIGLRDAYRNLFNQVESRYSQKLCRVAAIGVSGMMHGYLPLATQDRLLTPFRTWRNTITEQAAEILTKRFDFNIPQRWSIAHLYQAVLNHEASARPIEYLTTLAGYVHYKLTGQKVLGIGEASGMFPIDSEKSDYHQKMIDSFDDLISENHPDYTWKLRDILPKVLRAGDNAGYLTEEGARLLDPLGNLRPGIPMAPPEGDAGTGMTATNAIAPRTGNVSAGTSVFAMIVLERDLSRVYPEIDIVTTPTGKQTAMVHCNNCTNEINAWADVFQGFLKSLGQDVSLNNIYTAMFRAALDGKPDGGGLLLYNFLSGEPVLNLQIGRPLLCRTPRGEFNFPNFMRVQIYSALAALKSGLDILSREQVNIDRLTGHGGFFKTPEVGQRFMAAAAGVPVSVMDTAGEGGPWGMSLLAAYMAEKTDGQTLEDFLENQVFAGQPVTTCHPNPEDAAGFRAFLDRYNSGIEIERAAAEHLR